MSTTFNARPWLALAFVSSGCLLAAVPARAGMSFTSLKTSSFNGTVAVAAMNNGKQVVGTAEFSVGFFGHELRGASWAGATGASVTATSVGKTLRPVDVNEAGVIAGVVSLSDTTPVAGVLSKGVLKTLHATESNAVAVNAQGWVVGTAFNYVGPNNERHTVATLWHDGLEVKLATPEGSDSEAVGINNAGQVVGTVGNVLGRHAVRWVNGVVDWTGPNGTVGVAINGTGQVLMNSSTYRNSTATLWTGSALVPIAPEQALIRATALNAAGAVVGTARGVPFIWQNGVFQDLTQYALQQGAKLPTKGVITQVMDINDLGDVLVSVTTTTAGFNSNVSGRLNMSR